MTTDTETVFELEVSETAALPTRFGVFRLTAVRDSAGLEHAALAMGDLSGPEPVLCRLHSECLTGDTFGSLRCDCGAQLNTALSLIAGAGRGVLLYLRQEGRGIGLFNKVRAYALQDQGLDTVEANLKLGFPADARRYEVSAAILRLLKVSRVILLTNNPAKVSAMRDLGIEVTERRPLVCGANRFNSGYLKTKATRMGHLLSPEPS